MTGVAQTGAQISLNALTRASLPVLQSSAPTWFPGLIWIDTTSGATLKVWNGSAWVTSPTNLFLALLSADPTGQTTIAGLTECADSGYSRISVTFSQATAATPSVAANSSLLAFGPFSVNMSVPCQWLALVSSASGTVGQLHETWTLSTPQQVLSTQTIDIAAGALTITQS